MAKAKTKNDSGANLGFEAKLWLTADKMRNNMDAAEYKHVVLRLIFLKYISDAFEEHHEKLEIEADIVDCMVALPAQLFYSTQIPVCLWFLARNKSGKSPSPRTRGEGRGWIKALATNSRTTIKSEPGGKTDEQLAGELRCWLGSNLGASPWTVVPLGRDLSAWPGIQRRC